MRVGVESIDGVQALAAAVGGLARPPTVLIEIDSGGQRTGVVLPTDVVDIAEAIRSGGLELEGVFTHGGHAYEPGRAVAAGEDETRALETAADALEAEGFEVRTISAGTTPTRLLTSDPVNEVRAGTYVLGDRQQASVGAIAEGDVAIAVAATVVSVKSGRFVVDAGAKSLTKDRAGHLVGHGTLPAYPNAIVDRLSDYHGVVVLPDGDPGPGPKVGDVVAIVPNHVCPVVDLFDFFTVVNADGSTERWPVDARGKSR